MLYIIKTVISITVVFAYTIILWTSQQRLQKSPETQRDILQ